MCHLVTTEEGCAQWGYVNSSKVGRPRPFLASTEGREHAVSASGRKATANAEVRGGVQGKARRSGGWSGKWGEW